MTNFRRNGRDLSDTVTPQWTDGMSEVTPDYWKHRKIKRES